MAEWKKVIVSGSSPEFAAVTVDGTVTANAFSGDGSGLTGVAAGSINIDGFTAGTVLAQTDLFLYSDGGTEKSITFSNIEDELFGNVSGDATIAAGGALTIANSAVETVMIADDNVTTAKLQDDAVTNAKVADNAVSTTKIVDANVTTGKIANDAVTYAKVQNVASNNVLLGNDSGAGSAIQELTATEVRTILNVENGADVTDAAAIAALNEGIISGSAQISGLGFFDAASDVSMGGDLSGTAAAATINNGAVDAAALATNAVTTVKITDGNVTTAKIADDGVTNAKIAAGAVDTTELATDAVTNAKIAAGAVGTTELAADAVTAAKLADNAVVTANIVDANVTTAKIADDAITNAKIATDAVNADSIAANSVGTSELAATIAGSHTFFALSTSGDMTVGGNLSVAGTTATINVTNLTVDDQLILLNSGSTSGDTGIVFGGSNGTANQGATLFHDDSDDRLVYITGDVDPSSTGEFFTTQAHYSIVGAFEGTEGNAATAKANKVGNIRVESSEIYIYV